MANPQTYAVRASLASPTGSATLPALQIAAAAGKPLEVYRVSIDQETVGGTAGVTAIELVRSTATAPGTLGGAVTPAPLNPSDAAASMTVNTSGFAGGLTGTQTVILRDGFNVLSGFLYVPVPEERLMIAGGGFLWVRLPLTVPAATYNIVVMVRELG